MKKIILIIVCAFLLFLLGCNKSSDINPFLCNPIEEHITHIDGTIEYLGKSVCVDCNLKGCSKFEWIGKELKLYSIEIHKNSSEVCFLEDIQCGGDLYIELNECKGVQ